ncbi:43609_t:CDS:2 [Gigaspora margarita]|uniref:43609_t:CDS:1 n=1 Tax=Gigaspora margarita TaxID=4874 RepID=A0ABN7UR28_GIGMA|nr:43609_t:CDS:2 [Gigaspora margarita]
MENSSKFEITREQLQAGERSYHKTTSILVKKLPENKSKPGEESNPKTTPTAAKKLIENSSKPDEKNYSNPVKEIRKQLQIWQKNYHRTVPNLQRS